MFQLLDTMCLPSLLSNIQCTPVHLTTPHRTWDDQCGFYERVKHVSFSNAHPVVCFVLLLPSVGSIRECSLVLPWFQSETAQMDAYGPHPPVLCYFFLLVGT